MTVPPEESPPSPFETAQSFRVFGHTRMNARDLGEPPKRNDRGPPDRLQNYACAFYLIKILYALSYLDPGQLCSNSNTAEHAKSCLEGPLNTPQWDEFVIKSAKLLYAD